MADRHASFQKETLAVTFVSWITICCNPPLVESNCIMLVVELRISVFISEESGGQSSQAALSSRSICQKTTSQQIHNGKEHT
jgi:hypothetical protein